MEILAILLCLLAGIMVFLRSYTTWRDRDQATIIIADPAIAHRALIVNADDFSNRPAAIFPVFIASLRDGERNDNMTTVKYGPRWRALRCNLAAGILHPSRLASVAPLQQEAAKTLVDGLSSRCEEAAVRIRGPVTNAAFALSARLCFGDAVDANLRRAMGQVTRDSMVVIGELGPRFDGSMMSKLVNWRGLNRISALLDRQAELYRPQIAEARRQSQSFHPRLCGGVVPPYVDSLVALRVPDDDGDDDAPNGDGRRPLRETEVVGLLFEFLGAGTGSVVACVEWTLAHLVDQPDVQSKLHHEIIHAEGSGKSLRSMPYMNAVVLESLRMHPPVPFTLDKKTWTDPDEYRPERFLPLGEAEHVGPTPGQKEIRMMPFGAGHRHCPGVGMGMMLIKCFLATLVREFEWAPSAQGRSGGIDMTELDGFLKMMKTPLSASVTRRR
ncbi:cytochrome P450 89A2-like [Lolium rigidum]|uniref:cytochrome P450 89A2-like n=1 Tax=Lolium rigidum TaxID=89674 RepID=UPI001F5C59C1|nr:cytochrome P450 89A2-like [Lolium rigidum]